MARHGTPGPEPQQHWLEGDGVCFHWEQATISMSRNAVGGWGGGMGSTSLSSGGDQVTEVMILIFAEVYCGHEIAHYGYRKFLYILEISLIMLTMMYCKVSWITCLFLWTVKPHYYVHLGVAASSSDLNSNVTVLARLLSYTVVPLFSGHYWFQASVPTLGVSPHQGDRHSGMGGGAVGGLCLCI